MSAVMDEKIRAAYALNLWTVSVAQIVDYNDLNVLEQEYDNIINNINIENMPKDDALRKVINSILDEIMNLRMDEGDRQIAEKQYQHRMKTAIWNAIPSVGGIFATSDPIAMGVTLATQIGIGYMNYRRAKADNELEAEKERWNIAKNRMMHLHGLQTSLLDTAIVLAKKYEYPEEYRLTPELIGKYNKALMEANPVRRYNLLYKMQKDFAAYPHFWYQLGSTANYIYRNAKKQGISEESENIYLKCAISCFEKYKEINKYSILRKDIITSSWALEYFELQFSVSSNKPECIELIQQAEKFSGHAPDVLELCAFSYLKLSEYDKAIELFSYLVNLQYNLEINIQILSALYIYQLNKGNATQSQAARFGYEQLTHIVDAQYRHYILLQPPAGTDFSTWKLEWNKNDDVSELIKKKEAEQEKNEVAKEKVRCYFSKPCCIVYSPDLQGVAIELIELMNLALIKYKLPLIPIKRSIDEYKNDHRMEDANYRIIFLGDSKEARPYYKSLGDNEWDYKEMGIRIKQFSDGKVAVILASPRHIDDTEFIDHLARKKRLKWKLPVIKKMTSKEMNLAQYQLAIHEYLQLNNALILD